MKINDNYLKLKDSYLFYTINKKVNEYSKNNPDKQIIRLGIGDVTLPLTPVVIEAMQKAVSEMGNAATFRGYGDEQGYLFVREAICKYYNKKNVKLCDDEVFISDGAKSDIGNILDIFSANSNVLIPDPVYPVYVDTNIMAGNNITYMNGNIENDFLPLPDKNIKADIIYLCSPNNPTGAVYNKKQLELWVEYAISNNAVILFDSAYEFFIKDSELPTSIYQIEKAKECAIEFSSLSKMAGFTGTRCGYTIVPHELVRNNTTLNKLWRRRQTTKFNGVPYIIQRGAQAVFSDVGLKQNKENILYYMQNAKIISNTLTSLGIWHTGGLNSPYIWFKCPKTDLFRNCAVQGRRPPLYEDTARDDNDAMCSFRGNCAVQGRRPPLYEDTAREDNDAMYSFRKSQMSSWEFFDLLLEKANIVGTPGAGFGENGNDFFRLSAFNSKENVITAMERFSSI